MIFETVLRYFPTGIFSLILTSLGLTWLGWRIWRFTLLPIIEPQLPKEYPYLIPYIGHTRAFLNDADKVYTAARLYFGNTREPFSITVMGERLYIITSPKDVVGAWKHTTALTFDPFIRKVIALHGATPETVEKMFHKPKEGTSIGKSFMEKVHEDYILQLYPGEKLNILQNTFLEKIEENLSWDRLCGEMLLADSSEEKSLSLWAMCREVLSNATLRSLFGDNIVQIAPEILPNFFLFDEDSWMFYYEFPKYTTRNMWNAKTNATKAVEKYFSLPKSQRPGASWLIETHEKDMRALGMDNQQISMIEFMTLFVTTTNVYKMCFWVLAFMLHDRTLFETISNEVSKSFHDGKPDIEYLLKECPQLESVYTELLRIANMPAGARTVEAKVEVGGKELQPGNKLLMPFRQLHTDEEVFGPNAKEFDAYRFLKNKNLTRSSSFRPFGGATTYCPGRFLVRQEVYFAVAVILHRYDITVLGKGETGGSLLPRFPRFDGHRNTGGMMLKVPEDDIHIKVKMAKRSEP